MAPEGVVSSSWESTKMPVRSMATFPRWIIRLQNGGKETCRRYECDREGHVIGFSTRMRAMTYLLANQKPGMQLNRLKPVEAFILLADMHEFDVKGMCVDPSPDGTCSVVMALSTLAA